jgi:hypothetical protein
MHPSNPAEDHISMKFSLVSLCGNLPIILPGHLQNKIKHEVIIKKHEVLLISHCTGISLLIMVCHVAWSHSLGLGLSLYYFGFLPMPNMGSSLMMQKTSEASPWPSELYCHSTWPH